MHTIGLDGECNIDAIIDDEGDSMFMTDLPRPRSYV